MFRPITAALAVWAVVLAVFAAIGTYAGVVVKTIHLLQERVVEQSHLLIELRDRDALAVRSQEERLLALERELYGMERIVPPKNAPPGPEVWQRNRDRELRRRIKVLEKWRYSHER